MAVPQVIHGSTEMLQIADAVAREKNIDRDTVLDTRQCRSRSQAARNTASNTTSRPRSTRRPVPSTCTA